MTLAAVNPQLMYLSENSRMQIRSGQWLGWLWLMMMGWASARATDIQSLALIQATAEQHLAGLLANRDGMLHIKAADLDSRLRLTACTASLTAFLPSGANPGSRVTVGVRCTQGNQWTIYVPVSIESDVPILALNKALARGQPVTDQDVETRVQRVPGLASEYMKTAGELRGKRLKRALPAGTLLGPTLFEPEILIHRGQQVMVVARISGIEVRTQAIAMGDGAASSRIQVKNLNSAKVVEGWVDSSTVVRIDL